MTLFVYMDRSKVKPYLFIFRNNKAVVYFPHVNHPEEDLPDSKKLITGYLLNMDQNMDGMRNPSAHT